MRLEIKDFFLLKKVQVSIPPVKFVISVQTFYSFKVESPISNLGKASPMNRSYSYSKVIIILLLASGVLSHPHLGQAEALFVQGGQTGEREPANAERFPESQFGAAPSAPDLGTGSLASVIADESEKGERRPANEGTPDTLSPGKFAEMRLPKSTKGLQEISLIVNESGFYPKTLFVTRDIPVRLFVTGSSAKNLCIMMDEFQVRRQIRSLKVEEIQFTPTSASGPYRFYCPINGLEGTLFVKDGPIASYTHE